MDLDLFDVFESSGNNNLTHGAEGEIASNSTATGQIRHAGDSGHDMRAKRAKISHESTDKPTDKVTSAVDVEVPIFTEQTTSTNDEGTHITTMTAMPVDYAPATDKVDISNNEPAKVYPFQLDPFQQEAVNCIERNESVLVAAHTSAGKTAVAEYAIAKSLKQKQRVIYTSPIKALSNQKYRDMQAEFNDVGLMTGDMTINPTATCLIMTTEILRNMLYRGSEVMREVAWVIYDEVHYMRDKERGVVWEESIILLPHKVKFVFLSATIPNAKEFVGWVAKTHHQPCHVVYTDYRPVPLQHFVFPSGAEGLYLVVDEKGKFREDNFQRAMSCLHAPSELDDVSKGKKRKSGGQKGGSNSELFKIVRLIMDRQLDPCIVFSFSKKECETYALQMSRLDFNNDDEKDLVEQVFVNAMEALSDDDRQLPQVDTLLPLLKRGVGIHHGGLLPILKEVIEILFQEGLIKCLFATETFSIGINMPAKTVVFTSTRKFDGEDFRWITSGEYIQMSGRAGRRGKDDRGIVIQMLDEKMEPDVAKGMLYGDPDPLFSSYHVSYNMVLNMMRVEDADPENILRASFHQYQQEQNAPDMERQAMELQRSAAAIHIESESVVAEYHSCCKQLERAQRDMMTVVLKPQYCIPFFQGGRLIRVSSFNVPVQEWGWGVVVNCRKTEASTSTVSDLVESVIGLQDGEKTEYVLDVLLEVVKTDQANVDDNHSRSESAGLKGIIPAVTSTCTGSVVELVVLQVALSAVSAISAVRLNLPRDLRRAAARQNTHKALKEVRRRFDNGSSIPPLDPVCDMGIREDSFKELSERCEELKSRIGKSAFHNLGESKVTQLEEYEKKMRLLEEARHFRQLARESQTISMRDELRKMKRVLRRLGYTSADGVLETKGRFACELNSANELLLTDMIFEGVFNELSVDQCVALLSCFVHSEPSKSGSGNKIRQDLQPMYTQLQTIARKIARVKIDAKIVCDEEAYIASFNPELMEVAFAWSAGAKFVDVCKLTEVFEGSIIRVLRRLEELLRQLGSASSAIGNTELKVKFESGADRIRRGVVFAASLYL